MSMNVRFSAAPWIGLAWVGSARAAVAGWEGTTLVVETTTNGGTKLIQRY